MLPIFYNVAHYFADVPLASPSTTKRILSKFLNAFTPSKQPVVADVSTETVQAALTDAHTESEDYEVIGESSKDIGTELHDIVTIATLKVGEESRGCDQVDSPCSRKSVTKTAIPVHVAEACIPRRSPRRIGAPSKSVFSPVSWFYLLCLIHCCCLPFQTLRDQSQDGVRKMKAAGPDAFKQFSTPTSKPVSD